MANDRQFRCDTRFVATRGVREYRDTIADLVTPDDVVLELGCEWGTTTALLGARCREVIGTDVSRDCIARARAMHPGIRFEVLDAFDVRAALDLGRPFTKVYFDLSGFSGYRSLLDVIALLTAYATVLRPETIVVKSGALKQFSSRCRAWNLGAPPIVRPSTPLEEEEDTHGVHPIAGEDAVGVGGALAREPGGDEVRGAHLAPIEVGEEEAVHRVARPVVLVGRG